MAQTEPQARLDHRAQQVQTVKMVLMVLMVNKGQQAHRAALRQESL